MYNWVNRDINKRTDYIFSNVLRDTLRVFANNNSPVRKLAVNHIAVFWNAWLLSLTFFRLRRTTSLRNSFPISTNKRNAGCRAADVVSRSWRQLLDQVWGYRFFFFFSKSKAMKRGWRTRRSDNLVGKRNECWEDVSKLHGTTVTDKWWNRSSLASYTYLSITIHTELVTVTPTGSMFGV